LCFAIPFHFVIPEGNLRLPLPLPRLRRHPQPIARRSAVFLFAAALLLTLAARAQQPAPTQTTPPAPPTQPTQLEPYTPGGTILIQSHGDPPPAPDGNPAAAPGLEPRTPGTQPTSTAVPDITDATRSAFAITAYDLDLRLAPATAHVAMRAILTLKNLSAEPQPRIALQISSTLAWDSATLVAGVNRTALPLAQHVLDTDADHTGQATEAVFTLPAPLAPGESLTLDTFYSGTLPQSAARLERIGATPAQALDTDWDAASPTPGSALTVALRGFGNVLWLPAASPQLFLGDGNALFQAVDLQRLRAQSATLRLRLSVAYSGTPGTTPPAAAYLNGRRQPLIAHPDSVISGTEPEPPASPADPSSAKPVEDSTESLPGIATAEFPAAPIGLGLPSLFVLSQPETLLPAPPATPFLAVASTEDGPLPRLTDSAQSILPLLTDWFGPHPLSALTLLDHPGQPFEQGPLLVGPIAVLAASSSSPALAHSLTHAWVQTGQPWLDEGLAQFVSLLWIEQQQGRAAALAQLNDLLAPLALAEPTPEQLSTAQIPTTNLGAPGPDSGTREGQPLISATTEIYTRRKAASIFWQLRALAGDQPLQQALTAFRTQPLSHAPPADQALAFEQLLERTSGKDLAWFFNDWVFHDRGLPDLTLVDVTPRELPAGPGHNIGWLVAVTVRNEGAAAAEVPLVIRSGTFSHTEPIRIPGLSSVTSRIVVESAPTEVLLNDGSVPEVRTSIHTRDVVSHTE
jgi:hypothetical protein